jgi:UDP-2,3-diacylglucosamine hydrolase
MTSPGAPSLSGADVGLFASDMHLGDHDPATAALFVERLAAAWPQASHVVLLGDLFEAWVGDDQPDVTARDALALFALIAGSGRTLYVMRGNRDFLLDAGAGAPDDRAAAGAGTGSARFSARFSARTGATMLDDPCTATLFGEPVVLAHGDALCTDDAQYQRIRAQVRGAAWQADFLARPLTERLAIARGLRAESERVKAERLQGGLSGPASAGVSADIPAGLPDDVNANAVDALLRASGALTMIHGHTHRPACHEWQLDGRAARRWVLPDWDAATGRGGFLLASGDGFGQLGDWRSQLR